MKLEQYLERTQAIAHEEQAVLNQIRAELLQANKLNPISFRAAKSSMQVLVENTIGKLKQVLLAHGCPIVPTRASDAAAICKAVGYISHERSEIFQRAIGFRNTLIHDYMNFKEAALMTVLRDGLYLELFQFLTEPVQLSDVIKNRMATYRP